MTPKQRILIVMNYYYKKGVNRESVNKVYKNILSKCKSCGQSNGVHKLSCSTKKIILHI